MFANLGDRSVSVLIALVGLTSLGSVGCVSQDAPKEVLTAPLRSPLSSAPCPGEDDTVGATRGAIARVRSMAGLAPLRCDAPSSAAAQHHCAYVAANKTMTHQEVAGLPEFTGVDVWKRLAAQGFDGDVGGEVLSSLVGAAAMEDDGGLMNTVYHRTLFLRPTTVSMGIGHSAGCTTVDVGRSVALLATALVVWPPDGARGVPTTFDPARESPSPVPGVRAVGAPISLVAGEALGSVRATLRGPAGAVDALVITADTDSTSLVHPGDVHLVPTAPLAADTDYTAQFTATTADGRALDVSTSFHTVSP